MPEGGRHVTTGGLRDFVADTAEGEDACLVAVRSELSTAFTVRQEPGAAGSGMHRGQCGTARVGGLASSPAGMAARSRAR